MSYPELTRFDFHRNGHANRRDDDAQPRVLLVDAMHDVDADGFHVSEVVVHFAGDEFSRIAPVADAASMIEDMSPNDAYWLGRAVEGADVAFSEAGL